MLGEFKFFRTGLLLGFVVPPSGGIPAKAAEGRYYELHAGELTHHRIILFACASISLLCRREIGRQLAKETGRARAQLQLLGKKKRELCVTAPRIKKALPVGLEPTTKRLTAARSTN